jgi:hypothetical protein
LAFLFRLASSLNLIPAYKSADGTRVEQRKESRFKVGKMVTMRVMTPLKPVDEVDALMLDFSGNGMQLCSPIPLEAGTVVEILDSRAAIIGEVRRCTAEAEDYLVGIRIREYLPSIGETLAAEPPSHSE